MLILTRKEGESIYIGDNINVKIVSIDGNHCKLGITAPRDISVNREEIYQKIKAENQKNAESINKADLDKFAGLFKANSATSSPQSLKDLFN